MRSLDDLELEHESGGIDDESYPRCTTTTPRAPRRCIRSAARRRRRRRPSRSPVRRDVARRTRADRRGVVVFAVVAGVVARVRRSAPACPARRRRATRGRAHRRQTNAPRRTLERQITALQDQVNAAPDDYELRLQARRCAYEENGDLRERAQAVRRRDHASTPTVPRATPTGAAALPRSAQVPSEERAGAARGAGAGRVRARRSRSTPTTPTPTTSARCSLRGTARLRPRAERPAALPARRPTGRGRRRRASCSPRSRPQLESTTSTTVP